MFSMLKFADKYMVEPLKELIMSHKNESEPHRWAPDPASVIQVARSYDPTLLPLVFYQLSTLRRENVGDAREIFRDPPSTTARWNLLSQQDELYIERGRISMMIWIVNKFEAKDWNCYTDDCHLSTKTRLVEVHRKIVKHADPLEMLETLINLIKMNECQFCHRKWKSSILQLRAALFDSLGSFFPTG